jgi:2-phosphosulfolactate phosphatase
MRAEVFEFGEVERVRGAVVVIDVLRAFTTEAYALAAGARHIVLARAPAEALRLRHRFSGALVMGEVAGLPPDGFDFGNSPVEIARAQVAGRTLIHASSAGTVAALAVARSCDVVYLASLVTAGATAAALAVLDRPISFVVSGTHCGWNGDEDRACAELIAARMTGERLDTTAIVERVLASTPGRFLADPDHPEYVHGDLDACTAVDRFAFALRLGACEHGFSVLREDPYARV